MAKRHKKSKANLKIDENNNVGKNNTGNENVGKLNLGDNNYGNYNHGDKILVMVTLVKVIMGI